MGEYYLLAYSLKLDHLLYYTTQGHLSDNTTHSGLRPPTSILNQEMANRHAPGQSDEGNFSTEISTTKENLVYILLTKNNNHSTYAN